MPCHAGSLFDAGPWRPLDRNARRIWLAKADRARRDGHITALHVEIGRALLRRLGADGRLDPSHETIAADAGCCARTVGTALRRLRALGLLTWTRRLVRIGRRVAQTSSAYFLSITGCAALVAVATKRPPPVAARAAAPAPAPQAAVRPAYLSSEQLAVLRAGLVRSACG